MPTTWTDACAQGQTVMFGNIALASPEPPLLPSIAEPPQWFEAAFVTLHQAVEHMWLLPLPGTMVETLKPPPPQLCTEMQAGLVSLPNRKLL